MYPYKSHASHEILDKFREQSVKQSASTSSNQAPEEHAYRHGPPGHPAPIHRPGPPGHPAPNLRPPPAPPGHPAPNLRPPPQDHRGRPPSSRPPGSRPRRDHAHRHINHIALARCTGSLVYIWLRNGRDFWLHLTSVTARTLCGFAWTRHGWRYECFDLRTIEGFSCFG